MPPPPPEITTVQPLVRDVVVYLDKNGETESAGKAEVRSRVRGILKQIHFQSGQLVDEGTLLYSIEDDAYKASEAAAVASLASVEAEVLVAQANVSVQLASVEQAQSEFSRQEQLIAQRATSQAELDAAKANRSSAQAALEAAKASLVAVKASVQKAQAQLENARLELSYTQIQSPIRGRLTQSLVQLGNLLEPGVELVTVVDSEKLYVNFSLSDREAIDIGDARSQLKDQQARGPAAWSKTPVLIARETDRDFPFVGQMEYVSQEGVDVTNDDGRLFPGMFVKLRVPVRMVPSTLLLPEYVIQSDRTGKYVFLLSEEMQPKRQPVKLGKKMGGWFVVEDGINQQDQIVSEGFHLLAPGGITPKLRSYSDSELPKVDDAEVIKLFSPK
jgi:multidrug efflux pump subunit AcrA (membrane-fusion protein)